MDRSEQWLLSSVYNLARQGSPLVWSINKVNYIAIINSESSILETEVMSKEKEGSIFDLLLFSKFDQKQKKSKVITSQAIK